MVFVWLVFFFFKQKTAYELRISDWSSDVCSSDLLSRIAELQIGRLAKRLAERRLTLEVTPEALQWLADEGMDPAYGARPLRRLVQTAIGDRLAKEIGRATGRERVWQYG